MIELLSLCDLWQLSYITTANFSFFCFKLRSFSSTHLKSVLFW